MSVLFKQWSYIRGFFRVLHFKMQWWTLAPRISLRVQTDACTPTKTISLVVFSENTSRRGMNIISHSILGIFFISKTESLQRSDRVNDTDTPCVYLMKATLQENRQNPPNVASWVWSSPGTFRWNPASSPMINSIKCTGAVGASEIPCLDWQFQTQEIKFSNTTETLKV